MTLGEIINQYRQAHGLSIREFAKLSGLSAAYISMLEKGRHPTTGRTIVPTVETAIKIAKATATSIETVLAAAGEDAGVALPQSAAEQQSATSIPVYRSVRAGLPAITDNEIVDTEELSPGCVGGAYFGIRISGDSMSPTICNGDTVIVRQQPDAENGQIVIALVNGQDAVCKRLQLLPEGGLLLVSDNPAYAPIVVTNTDLATGDARILGRVVEARKKFF